MPHASGTSNLFLSYTAIFDLTYGKFAQIEPTSFGEPLERLAVVFGILAHVPLAAVPTDQFWPVFRDIILSGLHHSKEPDDALVTLKLVARQVEKIKLTEKSFLV